MGKGPEFKGGVEAKKSLKKAPDVSSEFADEVAVKKTKNKVAVLDKKAIGLDDMFSSVSTFAGNLAKGFDAGKKLEVARGLIDSAKKGIVGVAKALGEAKNIEDEKFYKYRGEILNLVKLPVDEQDEDDFIEDLYEADKDSKGVAKVISEIKFVNDYNPMSPGGREIINLINSHGSAAAVLKRRDDLVKLKIPKSEITSKYLDPKIDLGKLAELLSLVMDPMLGIKDHFENFIKFPLPEGDLLSELLAKRFNLELYRNALVRNSTLKNKCKDFKFVKKLYSHQTDPNLVIRLQQSLDYIGMGKHFDRLITSKPEEVKRASGIAEAIFEEKIPKSDYSLTFGASFFDENMSSDLLKLYIKALKGVGLKSDFGLFIESVAFANVTPSMLVKYIKGLNKGGLHDKELVSFAIKLFGSNVDGIDKFLKNYEQSKDRLLAAGFSDFDVLSIIHSSHVDGNIDKVVDYAVALKKTYSGILATDVGGLFAKNIPLGRAVGLVGLCKYSGINIVSVAELPGDSKEIIRYYTFAAENNILKVSFDLHKKSADLERASMLLNLFILDKKFVSRLDEIAKLEGKPEDIVFYCASKWPESVNVDVILGFYKTIPKFEDVKKYIEVAKSLGVDSIGEAQFCSKIIPDFNLLSLMMDDIKALKKKGLDILEALHIASSFGKFDESEQQLDKDGNSERGLDIYNNYSSVLVSKGVEDSFQHAILWTFTQDANEALRLFDKNVTIFKGGRKPTHVVIDYINSLAENSFSSNEIIKMFEITADIDTALSVDEIVEMTRDWKFSVHLDKGENEADGRIKVIGEMAKQKKHGRSDAGFKLLRHIFETSERITAKNVSSFFEDPSLGHCEAIMNKINDPDLALKVGRSLYLKDRPLGLVASMSASEISEVALNIEKMRNDVKNIPLFEGRNVVVLRHNEYWENGEQRFMPESHVNYLKNGVGPDGKLDVIGSNSKEPEAVELEALKKKTLKAIRETPPPFTFIFDGHGGPDGYYLSKGEYKNGVINSGSGLDHISASEIAAAIVDRKNKFRGRENDLSKDIYISSSCFSHTFLRKVLKKVKMTGGIAPIMMGESEYGQFGFTESGKRNAVFSVLGIHKRGSTIGDVMKNEATYKASNISIYVPDKEGVPQQVAENEKVDDGRAAA